VAMISGVDEKQMGSSMVVGLLNCHRPALACFERRSRIASLEAPNEGWRQVPVQLLFELRHGHASHNPALELHRRHNRKRIRIRASKSRPIAARSSYAKASRASAGDGR